MTIGRAKDSSLILFDPSCSRNHAEIFLGPDGSAWIKDLGSTNGTKVNGNLIKAPTVLNDGERIQLGDATILRFSKIPEDDARVQMDVYHRATRDALTGAYNRHQFQDFLDRELAYVRRGASPQGLGVISFDVDHFKKINDSFGHLAGDEILRDIGKRVATVIRTEDIFARVGGEEFIVLSRADSIEGVRILAERLREVMEKTPGEFEGRGILFTVSVGYTFLPRKAPNPADQILAIADECLYDAKHGGRNRSIGKELPPPPPGSAAG
jgi:diguanylate cyclase (GGDEF)-like protein